jgi:putative DNA primase/helicase
MKSINELHTDVGNARRLAVAYGEVLRYVPAWKAWLIWDESRWVRDDYISLEMRAKDVIRKYFKKAIGNRGEERDDDAVKHALRSERRERIRAMVELAKSEPGMCVEADQLDKDPLLLNCENGTIDLRTGELREHRKDDYITKKAPVVFDPKARDPLWEEHIRHVTRGNTDLAEYLQRLGGYFLTGLTDEEIILLFLGGSGTGKTTHLEALKAMMGDYAATADFETFLQSNQSRGPRNDLARLAGTRLVCASEVPAGRRFDEVTVKQLTGGDMVTARFLHQEHFEYRPQFKICLAANHRPAVRDDDPAIWRRLKVVPFDHAVQKPDKKRKAHFQNPLGAGQAILAWSVEGALKWRKDGLQEPNIVREAIQEYRSETEVFSQFVGDCCVEGSEQWAPSIQLISRYQGWSHTNGYKFPYGPARFRVVLRQRGHIPEKRGGVRGWKGIGLVPPKPVVTAIKKSA